MQIFGTLSKSTNKESKIIRRDSKGKRNKHFTTGEAMDIHLGENNGGKS